MSLFHLVLFSCSLFACSIFLFYILLGLTWSGVKVSNIRTTNGFLLSMNDTHSFGSLQDSLQAFSSSIAGLLTSRAVLQGGSKSIPSKINSH